MATRSALENFSFRSSSYITPKIQQLFNFIRQQGGNMNNIQYKEIATQVHFLLITFHQSQLLPV